MNRVLALLCGLSLVFAPAFGAPAAPPVEGTDYVTIDDARPYAPLQGKVEVVEVFGYWCPHCAEFEPELAAWARRLPPDVRFTPVPAVFTAGDVLARAYFTAQHFGTLPVMHDAIFQAIHADGTLPRNPSVDEMAAWFGQHGLDAGKAMTHMLSGPVEARLEHARQFALHSGVEGTPTLVINGRYRITAATHTEGLRTASALIQALRAAAHRPPHS
ncbi:MAG: dihydroneopterin aldolase [Xanthomonadaceae bacterium]|nr:dihydroneopterin aldolase [Xanthomonadaceae bacterium]